MNTRPATLLLVLSALALATVCTRARAEPQKMVVERVVPPNSSITYTEGGVNVRTVAIPEGRVRVTIEFGGPISLKRRKAARE